MIQYVNHAWREFATENGGDANTNWLQLNYLSVCHVAAEEGDQNSINVEKGLQALIGSHVSFFMYEYPCNACEENRWYVLRAVPLKDMPNRFVISHQNITRNKLLEQKAEKLSLEDPLTGLYNRRGLDLFASEEFARALRHQTEISIVMIDIDHFKIYNDYCGHQAGDECLVNIAKIIQHHARRPGDIVARIGGDEFVLVLAGTAKDHSFKITDAIKQNVYDLDMKLSDDKRVTISAGIITLVPDHQTDFKKIMYKDTDIALYSAKKHRNTIHLSEVG
ncbi:MAG: diguanylate cyclase (GGDEF)-like protein [Cellvibrionaceae bacterium]